MIPQGSKSSRKIQRRKVAWILVGFCLISLALALFSQADTTNQPVTPANGQDPGAQNDEVAPPVAHKDPRSVKQLAAALKDQDRSARGVAVVALGESKDPHAIKPLIGELKDGDPYVRALAGSALIEIGPPAVEPLIGVLKDSDPYVPAVAALALSSIKDPRAKNALMKALNDRNVKVILGIHTYYVKLGVPGSEAALIEALNKFPSRHMAEEFLNSGNPALADAANAWAAKYHQKIQQGATATSVRWGSAQDVPLPSDANPAPAPQ